ncbi:polysaccharide biosynthesis/export family protein [Consotaella salsifontis]|uniref:Exopolysaccharide production protein ExoF n=1 Tax=Consotaella salsifontis TaxID=1365950 RepID=A0A1T4SXJ6_9HYPH|nr:polysaccharide biosynthesis/export family protein [Consotaella salsifontis]SKA32995.1 exopolysaccharide production protein ExoF [Consotaella salsifontis]
MRHIQRHDPEPILQRGGVGSRSLPRTLVAAAIVIAALALSTASALAQSEYRLAIGDIVEFDFLDDDQPPQRLTIADDGRVQLPLIGGTKIADLTQSEALASIRQAYIDRKLLVDPKVNLAIAEFRPVFVLGDVRAPGSFPFRPLLTVEQAVALAGGPSTLIGDEQSRILQRTALRSSIEAIDADLARAAVRSAGARAQIDSLPHIADEDIPERIANLVSPRFLDEIKEIQEKIIAVDSEAFQSEKASLETSVSQAEQEIALLNDLATNQKKAIQYFQDEVDRSQILKDRQLTAGSEVARREQSATEARSRLLQIYYQIAQANRNLGDFRRQISQASYNRKQQGWAEYQKQQTEIDKLFAQRQSTEEQLVLLTGWTEADAADRSDPDITYRIRRWQNGSYATVPATAFSVVSPGDAVAVVVERPRHTVPEAMDDGRQTSELTKSAGAAVR